MTQQQQSKKIALAGEERYFVQGPHSRWKELLFTLRVMGQFIKGFRTLHFVGPCVTVFGSARFDENNGYYKLGRKVGAELSKMGFTVMTGGGPGIMEAANRGAKDVNGRSVACNIELSHEQHPNPYLDAFVTMDHFFVRKVLLFKYSFAFVVLPGGMGTMDEMFEALTLIQTKKIEEFPVVLMGKDYWKNLLVMMDEMVVEKTINKEDLNLLLVTDDVDEAMAHIRQHAVKDFGLQKQKRPSPIGWLGEKLFSW